MSSPLPIVVLLMTALRHSLGDFQSPCNGGKVRELYRLTSVTTCPTGEDRILKEQSCNDSSNVFHCLPDESGNLYTFCGKSKRYLRYSYFVVDHNDTLHFNNLGFTISPGTETELYSNLSKFIINAPNSLDRFPVFEKLQQELDLTATDACSHNRKGYVLPSRYSCNFISTCAQPHYVPCINIYIVNASKGYGSIIEREFRVPKTKEKKYAIIAVVLFQNFRSTLKGQCLELSATQNPFSPITSMHPKDPLPTETTSQQSCPKYETQICQECHFIVLSIIIVVSFIGNIVMGLEINFHCIQQKWLKRRQQSSENKEGQCSQPTDTLETNRHSNVKPSQS